MRSATAANLVDELIIGTVKPLSVRSLSLSHSMLCALAACVASPGPTLAPGRLAPRAALRRRAGAPQLREYTEEERIALRIPPPGPPPPPPKLDDSHGPDGRRRHRGRIFRREPAQTERALQEGEAAGEQVAAAGGILSQIALNGWLSLVLGYCYLVREQADAGAAWAVELLAQPNESLLLGFAVLLGAPPGGLFTAALATLNGLNVIRNMPMLFDRIVVARVSEGEDAKRAEGVG